jgi:hypothetical protein
MQIRLLTIIAMLENSATSAEVRRVVDSILADDEYQRSLPGPARWDDPELSEPGLIDRFLKWLFGLDVPGQLLMVLSVAALGVVITLLVLWIARGVKERRRQRSEVEEAENTEVEVPRRFLEEARDHASAGRFEGAVHALLLSAQEAIVRQVRATLSIALTSREILRLVSLPDETDLSALVQAVELSRFGDASLVRADYERCLGHHDRVIDQLRGNL